MQQLVVAEPEGQDKCHVVDQAQQLVFVGINGSLFQHIVANGQ